MVTFGEKDYTMSMVLATTEAEDIKYKIFGSYEMKERELTTNPTQVSINDTELSPATKQKYSAQLDKSANLANAKKNPTGSMRFLTEEKATISYSGSEVKLKKSKPDALGK